MVSALEATIEDLRVQLCECFIRYCHRLGYPMNTLSWDIAGALRRLGDHAGARAHLRWLRELHSKTWGRVDLRPQLFQERMVTRDHYYALQDRLKQKNQDRDSPQYNGHDHNVLSDKLEVLRLTNPPRHPDDNESDPDIRPLFPNDGHLFKYLDLSSLELENSSNRFPSPLLVREEYDYISKMIDGRPRSGGGSVIVSGQPGSGELLVSPSRRI